MLACAHPADQGTVLFAARDYVIGDRFEIVSCRACGFVVTRPQPSGDALAAYYPPGYYGAAGAPRFPALVEWLQNALYADRARQVEASGGGRRGRVLDVGCGRGFLLREFQRRGWEVEGTELTEAAAHYARTMLGLPVRIGAFETIGFPSDRFDAITAWHVLEHLPDPRAFLAEAWRVLKPGGVLFVGTPNFGGFEARLCRDKWFHLDVPRHLTHPTRTALRGALRAAGFREKRWSGLAPEYDCFSFVQSVLNLAGLRHNLLYDMLRGRLAKVMDARMASPWQVAATALVGAPLALLSIPTTVIAGLVNQGGTMTVLARKEAS